MQRILDPAQIEAFAQRTIPRLRLAERSNVFSSRAQRLRQLSGTQSVGHTIGDYLRLMADVADAQQAALASHQSSLPDAERISQARTHRMPLIHTGAWPRERAWRKLLEHVCESVVALPNVPDGVRAACGRLLALPSEQLEAQADALLAAQTAGVDIAAAPFLMAALQVYWTDLASRCSVENVVELDVIGVCPMCGTLPVASVVRADPRSQGYRYLCCALCATEWHMVRVTCSHCRATRDISYHSIEGGSDAIQIGRASCR